MIDDEAYVKALIKKQVEGTLTKQEYVEWKLAKLLYDEQIWFRMKVDAYCELHAARTDRRPVDWRPAFDRMQEKLKERERIARKAARDRRKTDAWWWLSGAAAAVALALFLIPREREPIPEPAWAAVPLAVEQAVECAGGDRDMVIPATDFAGAIAIGGAAPIAIDSNSWGHIARVGNLSIDRGADGYLSLSEMRPPRRADTVGQRDIRLYTLGGQQCGIRLADGTLVRLNMGSMLTVPLSPREPGTAFAYLRGEAHVQVPQRPEGTTAVLETKNGWIRTAGADFAVNATDARTSAALLDGTIRAISKHERKEGHAAARGERLVVITTHVSHRPMDAVLKEYLPDADEAVRWTKAIQEYRDMLLVDFIRLRGPWQRVRFKDMDCVPKHKRITVAMCYKATTEEFLAVIERQGVPVDRHDGQYALCDEKILKKRLHPSARAQADGESGDCDGCSASHRNTLSHDVRRF